MPQAHAPTASAKRRAYHPKHTGKPGANGRDGHKRQPSTGVVHEEVWPVARATLSTRAPNAISRLRQNDPLSAPLSRSIVNFTQHHHEIPEPVRIH
mgnify:CR=1 FL=1